MPKIMLLTNIPYHLPFGRGKLHSST